MTAKTNTSSSSVCGPFGLRLARRQNDPSAFDVLLPPQTDIASSDKDLTNSPIPLALGLGQHEPAEWQAVEEPSFEEDTLGSLVERSTDSGEWSAMLDVAGKLNAYSEQLSRDDQDTTTMAETKKTLKEIALEVGRMGRQRAVLHQEAGDSAQKSVRRLEETITERGEAEYLSAFGHALSVHQATVDFHQLALQEHLRPLLHAGDKGDNTEMMERVVRHAAVCRDDATYFRTLLDDYASVGLSAFHSGMTRDEFASADRGGSRSVENVMKRLEEDGDTRVGAFDIRDERVLKGPDGEFCFAARFVPESASGDVGAAMTSKDRAATSEKGTDTKGTLKPYVIYETCDSSFSQPVQRPLEHIPWINAPLSDGEEVLGFPRAVNILPTIALDAHQQSPSAVVKDYVLSYQHDVQTTHQYLQDELRRQVRDCARPGSLTGDKWVNAMDIADESRLLKELSDRLCSDVNSIWNLWEKHRENSERELRGAIDSITASAEAGTERKLARAWFNLATGVSELENHHARKQILTSILRGEGGGGGGGQVILTEEERAALTTERDGIKSTKREKEKVQKGSKALARLFAQHRLESVPSTAEGLGAVLRERLRRRIPRTPSIQSLRTLSDSGHVARYLGKPQSDNNLRHLYEGWTMEDDEREEEAEALRKVQKDRDGREWVEGTIYAWDGETSVCENEGSVD